MKKYILVLLYNVNEIRAGISELKTYYKYYNVTFNLINKLEDNIWKEKANTVTEPQEKESESDEEEEDSEEETETESDWTYLQDVDEHELPELVEKS